MGQRCGGGVLSDSKKRVHRVASRADQDVQCEFLNHGNFAAHHVLAFAGDAILIARTEIDVLERVGAGNGILRLQSKREGSPHWNHDAGASADEAVVQKEASVDQRVLPAIAHGVLGLEPRSGEEGCRAEQAPDQAVERVPGHALNIGSVMPLVPVPM
jgi:hypothetical protein